MQSAIKEEEEDLEVFSFYFETLVAAFFLFLLFSSQPSSKKRTKQPKPSALNLNLSFVAKLVICSSQTDRVFPVDQLFFCSASNLAFNFFFSLSLKVSSQRDNFCGKVFFVSNGRSAGFRIAAIVAMRAERKSRNSDCGRDEDARTRESRIERLLLSEKTGRQEQQQHDVRTNL